MKAINKTKLFIVTQTDGRINDLLTKLKCKLIIEKADFINDISILVFEYSPTGEVFMLTNDTTSFIQCYERQIKKLINPPKI